MPAVPSDAKTVSTYLNGDSICVISSIMTRTQGVKRPFVHVDKHMYTPYGHWGSPAGFGRHVQQTAFTRLSDYYRPPIAGLL